MHFSGQYVHKEYYGCSSSVRGLLYLSKVHKFNIFIIIKITLAIFFAMIAQSHAQGENGSQSKDEQLALVKTDQTITIIGTKERQGANEGVDEKNIRRTAAKDAAEAASHIPGIHMIRKGNIAADIVLRDSKADSVSATVDGQHLWGACPNRMDPAYFHTDFSQLESIEIIKGPFNVRQSGSSGGSVIMRTEEPDVEQEKYAEGQLGYGSFNYLEGSVKGSASHGKVAALAGVSHRRSDVYLDGNGDAVTKNRGYAPQYSKAGAQAYQVSTLWSKVGLDISKKQKLMLSGSYQDAKDVLYPYLLMDAPEDNYQALSAKYRHELGGKLNALNANVYYNSIEHLMDNAWRTSAVKSLMETSADSSSIGFALSADFMVLDGLFVNGVDYYARNWNAENSIRPLAMNTTFENNMIPDVVTQNFGLFAEYQTWLESGLSYSLGLRVDLAQSQAREKDADLRLVYWPQNGQQNQTNFKNISANAQTNYEVNEKLSFFSGIGLGHRLPDPSELFISVQKPATASNWVGNAALKPEKRLEFDLGSKWQQQKSYVKATVFYAFLYDYIAVGKIQPPDSSGKPPFTQAAKTYSNTNAQTMGAEAQSQIQIIGDFYLLSKLALLQGSKKSNNLLSDPDLPEIMPIVATLGIKWEREGIYSLIETEMAAEQNKVDSDLNETRTAPWAVINIKAGIEKEKYALRLILGNLLGAHYYNHLSAARDPFSAGLKLPEPGFNFMIQASYRF